jgi:hypothetical protein
MLFYKFRRDFLIKFILTGSILFFLLFLLSDKSFRNHIFPYFSTRCLDYRQKEFSRKLNDRIVDYSDQAKLRGVTASKNEKELRKKLAEGKLVKVTSGNKYIIERMIYSYPYVTKDSKLLLDEIARRLREKTSDKGLKGVRLIVTSMTRKTESVKTLRRFNRNASANSPHQYGNAFDITYKRFKVRKWMLTNCDDKFLKEALAEVIWQLRQEKKCWATYEKGQSCFHIVSR